MGDGEDDPDLTLPIIVVLIVVILLCLAFFRYGTRHLPKCKKQQKRDEENLSSPAKRSRSVALFTCCSEIETKVESANDNGNNDQSCSYHAAPGQEISVQPTFVDIGIATDDLPRSPKEVTPRRRSSFNISNIKAVLKYLQEQQSSSQNETNASRVTRIRSVQNIIQLENAEKPTEEKLETPLVIGVDATPKVLGGYCVNMREMRVEYYIIKMEDFPWPISNLQDPTEFEMKNLQFALAIWSDSIIKLKRARVYTDNNGIHSSSVFGQNVKQLLRHYIHCENVRLVDDPYVNRMEDLTAFAKYIQPADDLSRWQVEKAVEFLCKFYGINGNRTRGTVKLTRHGATATKPYYDPSEAYNVKIEAARSFGRRLRCHKCNIRGLK